MSNMVKLLLILNAMPNNNAQYPKTQCSSVSEKSDSFKRGLVKLIERGIQVMKLWLLI